MSLLRDVELAPRDAILGLTEAFNADPRDTKVNLGVGVYQGADGKVPLLDCVRAVDEKLTAAGKPYGYLPIDGLKAYDDAVAELIFGDAVPRERVAVVQALGGTGALKVAGDFLHQLAPEAHLLISDPSWENHRALFTRAGFEVSTYPYYDAATRSVDVEGMLAALSAAEPGTVVVLHACCHNPTGVDLSPADWKNVLEVVKAKNLVPFLDMAYQGFGDGIDEDAAAVRLFAESGLNFFVSSSFSKSFSLYGERVGALSIVSESKEESARVLSQVKRVIRTNYSNPPTHGAAVVAAVLNSPELRAQWEQELAEMRLRIRGMRTQMVDLLAQHAPDHDFSFVGRQCGMFSYSGLTVEQVTRLRNEFGIYALDTGRICVAALNQNNIAAVTQAIVQVI